MDLDFLKERRGVYLLFFEVQKENLIEVGKLGKFLLNPGIYIYVGSAKGGFKRRLMRYIEPKEKKRWHIDYLVPHSKLRAILLLDGAFDEEEVAFRLLKILKPAIIGFGASDSKAPTHLFFAEVIE